MAVLWGYWLVNAVSWHVCVYACLVRVLRPLLDKPFHLPEDWCCFSAHFRGNVAHTWPATLLSFFSENIHTHDTPARPSVSNMYTPEFPRALTLLPCKAIHSSLIFIELKQSYI